MTRISQERGNATGTDFFNANVVNVFLISRGKTTMTMTDLAKQQKINLSFLKIFLDCLR